jgi:hypothetical protein
MAARREIRSAKHDAELLATTRARISFAKRALGERGAVWWTDGAPDYNRRMIVNTPYAAWFKVLDSRVISPEPIDCGTEARGGRSRLVEESDPFGSNASPPPVLVWPHT